MKFKIQATALKSALQNAKKFTDKGPMPILGSVLIDCGQTEVEFHATNLEVGSTTNHLVDVYKPGKVVVPVKPALAVIKKLKGEITVESYENDGLVFGSSEQGLSAKLSGGSPEDFPAMPVVASEVVRVPCASLYRALSTVLFACSKDETRYNLNGVCIESEVAKKARCIATDGHRLAVADAGAITLPWKGYVIIPQKAVALMLSRMKDPTEVVMAFEKHLLLVAGGGWNIRIRTIDGEYPNWHQVLPKRPFEIIQVNRDEFAEKLASVAMFSAERSQAVTFTINSAIEITAKNPDTGEASATCECDRDDGREVKITFNSGYLLQALGAFSSEKICLDIKDGMAPVRITEKGKSHPFCVVMPMRL